MADLNGNPAERSPCHSEESEIDEDLWPSPTKTKPKSARPQQTRKKSGRSENGREVSPYLDQSNGSGGDGGRLNTKEHALRSELQGVRKVNEAIEGAIESLEKAKDSMKTVNATVAAASSLLSTWTKILSQAEHNKRLILNPSWQGASQDVADAEQEAVVKQQAVERRENEEQERRAAVARKEEDDERRREEAIAQAPKGGSKGRVARGLNRGRSTKPASTTNHGAAYGVARGSSIGRRTTSGIGRGTGSLRGRSRG